jgi:hypothetical protein
LNEVDALIDFLDGTVQVVNALLDEFQLGLVSSNLILESLDFNVD